MKIGIFGGTFDPPTPAHCAIIDAIFDNNLVDLLIVIPTIIEYYRKGKKPMLSHVDRMLACTDCFAYRGDGTTRSKDEYNKIVISDYEYKLRKDLTHTTDIFKDYRYIHTLRGINAIYNWSGNHELYTIIGTDSLVNFKTWYKWEDILNLSKLIVIDGRDGITAKSDIPFIPVNISSIFANISSSKIREKYNNLDDYLKDFPNVNT